MLETGAGAAGQPHPTAKRKRFFPSPEAMIERFADRPPYRVFEREALRDYCRYGLLPVEGGDLIFYSQPGAPKVRNIEHLLPPGAGRPDITDDFGDVFGFQLAVVGDGYSDAELEKSIVLTGAMVPYSIDPVEATANLCSAYGFMSALKEEGIFIAMNGVIGPYDKVKKDRAKGRFTL